MHGGLARGLLSKLARGKAGLSGTTGIEYWNRRARKYGARAAVNLQHPAKRLGEVTQRQRDELLPRFRSALEGWERNVLDFGCGPGRFTPDLAREIGGQAVGVDPVEHFLQLAPAAKGVRYELMTEGEIPLDDESVDALWVCLVLGGIIDTSLLECSVNELDRVLRPNGLAFLVENTTAGAAQVPDTYWRFRTIEEYRSLIPFVELRHLGDYFDRAERISILAGRKTGA